MILFGIIKISKFHVPSQYTCLMPMYPKRIRIVYLIVHTVIDDMIHWLIVSVRIIIVVITDCTSTFRTVAGCGTRLARSRSAQVVIIICHHIHSNDGRPPSRFAFTSFMSLIIFLIFQRLKPVKHLNLLHHCFYIASHF